MKWNHLHNSVHNHSVKNFSENVTTTSTYRRAERQKQNSAGQTTENTSESVQQNESLLRFNPQTAEKMGKNGDIMVEIVCWSVNQGTKYNPVCAFMTRNKVFIGAELQGQYRELTFVCQTAITAWSRGRWGGGWSRVLGGWGVVQIFYKTYIDRLLSMMKNEVDDWRKSLLFRLDL